MRKRKYSQLKQENVKLDCLVESIDDYFAAQNKTMSTDNSAVNIPEACIHNLVGTANIESSVKEFDLEIISKIMPNATYDQQKFAAITIRIVNPVCTVLLFTSGKMVLTGCRSLIECYQASLEIVCILRRGLIGVRFMLRCVNIQNIVGNVDLGLTTCQTIDLERFYTDLSVYCTFQKNMFPGLIYRANYSPVVLLIFQSGKIVITGGKSTEDIFNGWKQLWPTVRRYIVVKQSNNFSPEVIPEDTLS